MTKTSSITDFKTLTNKWSKKTSQLNCTKKRLKSCKRKFVRSRPNTNQWFKGTKNSQVTSTISKSPTNKKYLNFNWISRIKKTITKKRYCNLINKTLKTWKNKRGTSSCQSYNWRTITKWKRKDWRKSC